MPTEGVRLGAFDETEALEIPLHWRNLIEDKIDFYKMLMDVERSADEITESEVAMTLIFRFDLE